MYGQRIIYSCFRAFRCREKQYLPEVYLQACPEIKFSVSYTSRTPRPNEVNGKDYYFISREEFQARIDQGEFVEWVENYGNLYGSSDKTMEEVSSRGPGFIAGYRTARRKRN